MSSGRTAAAPRPGRWTGPLAGAWLALLGACADGSPPPGAAARVADELIAYDELAAYAAAQMGEPAGDDGDGPPTAAPAGLGGAVLSGLLDQMIEERLLVRLALDEGLVAPAADGRVDPRRALAALLAAAGPSADAGDAEPAVPAVGADPAADAAPDAIAEAGAGDRRRVRLRQLLIEDRETAERARRELAAGADFAELARRYTSDDAPNGGFEGVFERDELPAAYTDLIFSLEPGEVSEVVPADYGYHLFQVTGHPGPPGAAPADADAAADDAARRLLTRALDLYTVDIYEENLPFDYRGVYAPDPRRPAPG